MNWRIAGVGCVLLVSSCSQVKHLRIPDPPTHVATGNGLSGDERNAYYKMDEGIHYMPFAMLDALRRPQPEKIFLMKELFLDRPERFGIARNFQDPADARALIGLTTSRQDEGYLPMAGINCATCHTSVLEFGDGTANRRLVVDGASSNFSIARFITEMANSTLGTLLGDFGPFFTRYRNNLGQAERISSARKSADDQELAELETALQGPAGDAIRRLENPDEEVREQLAEFVEFESGGIGPGDASRLADAGVSSVDSERIARNPYIRLVRQFDRPHTIEGMRESMPGPGDAGVGPLFVSGRLVKDGCPDSLTDACVPRHLVDSPFEAFIYLVKRMALFIKASGYADSKTDTAAGLGRSHPWSVTKNMLRANKNWKQLPNITAPINTPRMWNFENFSPVFMAGVTNSMIERNLAQGVALVTDFDWRTNETPVSTRKLEAVSKLARKICPPSWPSEFGAIDAGQHARGRELFNDMCATCHGTDPASDQVGVPINYQDVGTDPNYSDNQVAPFTAGREFFPELERWLRLVKETAYKRENVTDIERAEFEKGRLPIFWKAPDAKKLEAKPLRGVWATGPFLHNGSIRTLYQLLNPPKRDRAFYVGTYKFDPVELGFVNEKPDFGAEYSDALFESVDANGKPVPGNSNAGHEKAMKRDGTLVDLATLDEGDRKAILEYLKNVEAPACLMQ